MGLAPSGPRLSEPGPASSTPRPCARPIQKGGRQPRGGASSFPQGHGHRHVRGRLCDRGFKSLVSPPTLAPQATHTGDWHLLPALGPHPPPRAPVRRQQPRAVSARPAPSPAPTRRPETAASVWTLQLYPKPLSRVRVARGVLFGRRVRTRHVWRPARAPGSSRCAALQVSAHYWGCRAGELLHKARGPNTRPLGARNPGEPCPAPAEEVEDL